MTNYKSDFSVLISFCDCRELFALKPYEYDFEVDFYTTDRKKTYRAFRQGEAFVNCRIEGEKLRVVFNDHHLPPGELCAEMTYHIPDNLFPDGEQKVVVTQRCGVTLTREGGCPSVDEVELILPTIKGDKGDAAEMLPKIEFELLNDSATIRNYKYYLERGYVPLLFRKCARNIHSTPSEGNPSYRGTWGKIHGWQVCGGQGVISFDEDGELLVSKRSKALWDQIYSDGIEEENYIKLEGNSELLLNPHKIFEDPYFPIEGTRVGWVAVSWGRRNIVLYKKDTGKINPDIIGKTFRFRFAIGFAKPYKQGKVRITPKDCLSNLAEFSVRLVVCSGDKSTDRYALTY